MVTTATKVGSNGTMTATTNGSASDLYDRIRQSRPVGRSLEVPEWGVTVELRSLTIAQKGELVGSEAEMSPGQALRFLPRVVVMACHDPQTGARLFSDDDVDWLHEQPAAPIERIAQEALELSGLTAGAADEKKSDS